MDTVTILRDLWRLRLLVLAVYLLALLAGVAVIYKISFPPKLESRGHEVGVATARILVDTPSSQVVEVAPKGSDSLGVRANLLASLMVDGVVKSAIAHRAGLQPNQLVGVTEAATEPSPVSAPPGPRSFVLTTQVVTNTSGDQLPLIEVDAQAPDRARAARLAAAAVAGLRDYLDSKAALQQIPNADRLQVTGLGAPQATTETRGPGGVLAFVVVVVVFALGCACLLAALALVRAWRAVSVSDQEEWLLEDADADADAGEEFAQRARERPPTVHGRGRAPRSADGMTDNWLAAPSQRPPALFVTRPDARGAERERDEPQAKSA